PQRRVFDAVLEQERVAAGAQPLGARRNGNRAGVTVVAQSAADLLDAVTDVRGVGNSAAGRIDLIDVERPPVDQRPEGFAATLALAGRDRDRRAVAEPDVAVDVVFPQRLLEPLGAILGERVCATKCSPRVVDAAGVDQQGRVPEPGAGTSHQVDVYGFRR